MNFLSVRASLFLPFVAALLSCGAAFADPLSLEELQKLGDQLGAETFAARKAAELRLSEMGLEILPTILNLVESPDPEVRFRALRLYRKFEHLHRLRTGSYKERSAAAGILLRRAGGLVETDPGLGLFYQKEVFSILPERVHAKESLRTLKRTLEALPDEERLTFLRSEFGLYASSHFQEYLAAYPKGAFAPFARYCLIAGHRSYCRTEEGRWLIKIEDSDREIAEWPAFLKAYPDFAGADDAQYRYGRALEVNGRYVDAVRAHWPKRGDGELHTASFERIYFILDTRMDEQELNAFRIEAAGLKRNDSVATVPELFLHIDELIGLKQMRGGEFTRAAKTFLDMQERAKDHRAILRLARARELYCRQAAALAEDRSPEGLYALASFFYKEGHRRTDLFEAGQSLQWKQNCFSYRKATEPADVLNRSSRWWQAIQLYQAIEDQNLQTETALKATYMLGNCYSRLAEDPHRYWATQSVANALKSKACFQTFVDRYPDHEFTPTAQKAVDYLGRKWDDAP